jgi:hypothetical protein
MTLASSAVSRGYCRTTSQRPPVQGTPLQQSAEVAQS